MPDDAVARVGDAAIARGTFERLVGAQSHGNNIGGRNAPYEPPRYRVCTDAKLKAAKGGTEKLTPSKARQQCATEYRKLRRDTLTALIRGQWMEGAAKAFDVGLSTAQQRALWLKGAEQIFPTEAGYKRFLKRSGLRAEDSMIQFRGHELEQRVMAKVMASVPKPTMAKIEEVYRKNKKILRTPEQRRIRIVETHTKAQALKAKAALLAGQSWADVAPRYSIDKESARLDGLIPRAQETGFFPEYDRALLKSRPGVIAGPIHTGQAWELFVVERIYRSRQQSLKEVKKLLVDRIMTVRKDEAARRFEAKLRRAHRGDTVCSDEIKVPECSNGPPPPPVSSSS